MGEQRTYPHGVPCWIDTEQPDLAAASQFYGALFGWTFDDAHDAGPAGRTATCADPDAATFRLWQPRRRLGAQLVNAPGAWNFSNLRTTDPKTALAFYAAIFGWVADDLGA